MKPRILSNDEIMSELARLGAEREAHRAKAQKQIEEARAFQKAGAESLACAVEADKRAAGLWTELRNRVYGAELIAESDPRIYGGAEKVRALVDRILSGERF